MSKYQHYLKVGDTIEFDDDDSAQLIKAGMTAEVEFFDSEGDAWVIGEDSEGDSTGWYVKPWGSVLDSDVIACKTNCGPAIGLAKGMTVDLHGFIIEDDSKPFSVEGKQAKVQNGPDSDGEYFVFSAFSTDRAFCTYVHADGVSVNDATWVTIAADEIPVHRYDLNVGDQVALHGKWNVRGDMEGIYGVVTEVDENGDYELKFIPPKATEYELLFFHATGQSHDDGDEAAPGADPDGLWFTPVLVIPVTESTVVDWKKVVEAHREKYQQELQQELPGGEVYDHPLNKAITKVEYGTAFDCEAEGCDTDHNEEEPPREWPQVLGLPPVGKAYKINGHKVKWLKRTVTWSAWEEV